MTPEQEDRLAALEQRLIAVEAAVERSKVIMLALSHRDREEQTPEARAPRRKKEPK